MPDDRRQQLGQAQRDVGAVVGVGVARSPLLKAGQDLPHVAEVVLDVGEHGLGPEQQLGCGERERER